MILEGGNEGQRQEGSGVIWGKWEGGGERILVLVWERERGYHDIVC